MTHAARLKSEAIERTRRSSLARTRGRDALAALHKAQALPAPEPLTACEVLDGLGSLYDRGADSAEERLAEMGREALALCRAMRDCDLGSWTEELVIARQVALTDRLDALEAELLGAARALEASEETGGV